MSEDLTKLSKQELQDRMDALSKETTTTYDKVAQTKLGSPEAQAANVAYEAVTAKYAEIKAEWDKRVAS